MGACRSPGVPLGDPPHGGAAAGCGSYKRAELESPLRGGGRERVAAVALHAQRANIEAAGGREVVPGPPPDAGVGGPARVNGDRGRRCPAVATRRGTGTEGGRKDGRGNEATRQSEIQVR